MIIFILGKPNSGKGTQAIMVEEKYKMTHIDSGKNLRSWVAREDNYITRKVNETMDKGEFVPIAIATKLWMDTLLTTKEHENILFEGAPRKYFEAEIITEYFNWLGEKPSVFFIDIPDQEVLHRSAIRTYCPKCNKTYSSVLNPGITVCEDDQTPLQVRDDDKEEVVQNRLKVFYNEVQPSLDFFKERGMLHTIDGVGSVEEVFKRLDDMITQLM